MLKRFASLFLMLVMSFTLVGSALADDGSTGASAKSGGVVFAWTVTEAAKHRVAITNLEYHGGPVMHTNKTYAIYWIPAGYGVSATYKSLINRFLTDVAAADNLTSNVYYSDKQYYSVSGGVKTYITTTSTFGGAYLDTHAFPAAGCANYMSGMTKCLTDAQIQTEIKRVIALKGWVANATTEFFMFTPNKVGSQYNSSNKAFTNYCAYHSYTGNVIYSNMPYTGFSLIGCGLNNFVTTAPNGDFAADSTISVLSHEHNESITDPHLNAWWDNGDGYENGDNCAWHFGSTVPAHNFNQTINAHHYLLQLEWSNKTTKCVATGW